MSKWSSFVRFTGKCAARGCGRKFKRDHGNRKLCVRHRRIPATKEGRQREALKLRKALGWLV